MWQLGLLGAILVGWGLYVWVDIWRYRRLKPLLSPDETARLAAIADPVAAICAYLAVLPLDQVVAYRTMIATLASTMRVSEASPEKEQ